MRLRNSNQNAARRSLASLLLVTLSSLLGGCVEMEGMDYVDDEGGWIEDEEVDTASEALSLEQGLDVQERAFLTLINNYRASKGLGALKASAAATCAADFHSRDMAYNNHWASDHKLSDGTTWDRNLRNHGYTYSTTISENLAAGTAMSQASVAFDGWKKSPGHHANMIDPNFKVIGIARAYSSSSSYKYYWTTTFGGTVDEVFGSAWLANAGFESAALSSSTSYFTSLKKLRTWQAYTSSGTAPARTTASARTGSYGVRISNPADGRANVSQLVRSTPGRTYRLTAWARRVSGSGQQQVWAEFLDADYKTLAKIPTKTTTNGTWTKLLSTAKSPSGTRFVRVVMGRGTKTIASVYYWDTMILETICPNDGSAGVP